MHVILLGKTGPMHDIVGEGRKRGKVMITQLCPDLCNPMDCRPPGSSVPGVLQVRILKWVAIPFSRGSSQLRDRTGVSCIAGRFFTTEPSGTRHCYFIIILSEGDLLVDYALVYLYHRNDKFNILNLHCLL